MLVSNYEYPDGPDSDGAADRHGISEQFKSELLDGDGDGIGTRSCCDGMHGGRTIFVPECGLGRAIGRRSGGHDVDAGSVYGEFLSL